MSKWLELTAERLFNPLDRESWKVKMENTVIKWK